MDIAISGKIKVQDCHMAKMALDTLNRNFEKAISPSINPLTDTEWEAFLDKKKNDIRGEIWGFKSGCMAFGDGEFIGNADDLMRWAKDKFGFIDFRPPAFYEALGNQAYKEHLENPEHEMVYVDLVHDNRPMGRMVFELFKNIVPETVENFVALLGSKSDKKYIGTNIHRIVKNGWVQGGDFVNGSGANSDSFKGGVFPDENYAIKHDRRGTIGMANDGPHSNGSQFYITFQPAPWMDKNYVAMGYIIEGMSILNDVENIATFNERPKRPLLVHDCGLLANAL